MPKRYPMTTRITFEGQRIRVTPVKYYDEVLPGYFMDKDGEVYSTRRARTSGIVKLTASQNGRYPTVKIVDQYNKSISARIHRLVAYTLIPFKKPAEISDQEWEYINKYLPGTLKFIKEHTQVNHIDEDHNNFHPSNLEWMSGTDNRNAYHKNAIRSVQNFISECGMDIFFKMSKKLRKA